MRLAIIGSGFMGRTHADAITRIPEIEFAGFITRGNLSASLLDPQLDAVDVCVPTDLHASVAIEALRGGKHVLVEKPMALDTASCDRMIAEAERHDRVLMVAHVLRFSPAYQALERALAEQIVRAASFRRQCGLPEWADWLGDSARSGGGVFDLLIHDVDMALHLFGVPQSISASGSGDLISAHLHYRGGLTVDIWGGWHHAGFPFWMEYTVATNRQTLHYDSREPAPKTFGAYADEIAYFAECVREHKPPSRCPPRDSAEAVRLMLALIAARERNGEKIAWISG
jgi:predicted dehydrogenase